MCEDPGPGDVRVKLTGTSHEFQLNRRSFASKSEWFVHKLSFQQNKSEVETDQWVIELNPQEVSAKALAVVEKFVNKDELSYPDEVVAEQVLVAANYLQMDGLQAEVLEGVKKAINNANCVKYHAEYCAVRGVGQLDTYIMSTIVRPAEMARRRKYGRSDLVIKLSKTFPFKCHKTVLASASKKIKGILERNSSIEIIEGEDLGLTSRNVQQAYNLFEQIYLNEESFVSSSMEDSLEVLKLISTLEMTDDLYLSHLEGLGRQVSVGNVGELYHTGLELGQEEVVNLGLQYLTFKIQHPDLESLFLALPRNHVSQVLASSRLNVPDELTVGKLALKWVEAQEKVKLSLDYFPHFPLLLCVAALVGLSGSPAGCQVEPSLLPGDRDLALLRASAPAVPAPADWSGGSPGVSGLASASPPRGLAGLSSRPPLLRPGEEVLDCPRQETFPWLDEVLGSDPEH